MSFYFSIDQVGVGLTDFLHRFDIIYKLFAGRLKFNYVTYHKYPMLHHVLNDQHLSDMIQKSLGFYDHGIPHKNVDFVKEVILPLAQFESADEVINYMESNKEENVLYVVNLNLNNINKYIEQGIISEIKGTTKVQFEIEYPHSHFKEAYQLKSAKETRDQFFSTCSQREKDSKAIVHIRRNDTGLYDLKGFEPFLRPVNRKYKYFDLYLNKLTKTIFFTGKRDFRPYVSVKEVFDVYLEAISKTNLSRENTIVFSDLYSKDMSKSAIKIFQGDHQCKKALLGNLIDHNINQEIETIKKYFDQEILALGTSPKSTMLLIQKYLESELIVSTKSTRFDMLFDYVDRPKGLQHLVV